MRHGSQTLLLYLYTLAQRCDLEGTSVFAEIRGLCEDLDETFSDLQRQINELKQLTTPAPNPANGDDGHDTLPPF